MAREQAFKLEQAAVRLVSAPPLYSEEPIRCPGDAVRIMAKELKDYDREVLCVVNLKQNGQPINFSICSMGTLDASLFHPREILKSVFLSNAAGILLIHNHPSGRLMPSQEDIGVTDRLQRLCVMAKIELFDHIIIGAGNENGYFSFREKKICEPMQMQFEQDLRYLRMEPLMAAEKKPSIREQLRQKPPMGQEAPQGAALGRTARKEAAGRPEEER